MVAMEHIAQVADVASGGRSGIVTCMFYKAVMPTIVGAALDMMMIMATMAGSGQQQQSHCMS